MFHFTDDMRLGIQHIDNQHKELVVLVNHAASLDITNPNRFEIFECLNFLGEYVVKHFTDEENLQQESNYLYYPQHKIIHENFIATFKDLYTDFKVNGATSTLGFGLSHTVSNWLVSHIKGEDLRFGKHFHNKMLYDLFESREGTNRMVFPSFHLKDLPSFLASHYGLDINHARMTAEKLEVGEDCPPYGYVSRILSLRRREDC